MADNLPEYFPCVDLILLSTDIPELIQFNEGYYTGKSYTKELGIFQLLQVRDEGIVVSKPREDKRIPILIYSHSLQEKRVIILCEFVLGLN